MMTKATIEFEGGQLKIERDPTGVITLTPRDFKIPSRAVILTIGYDGFQDTIMGAFQSVSDAMVFADSLPTSRSPGRWRVSVWEGTKCVTDWKRELRASGELGPWETSWTVGAG